MPVSATANTIMQWEPIQLPNGPSPMYGVITGVVDNYWIITHGGFIKHAALFNK